ncbi:MAG: DNA repair protein RecO C-terminal domain-containing protein [Treponema sp.]|nr:DNA repair protein RecO C-terminal domain-containing protein [Treponema sp.]
MPNRNLVYEALILRTRESPAGDRILTMMTAEAGLVDVFVFGGPKSKLRSLASPFASGRAFVYLDPAKDFRKLSDFEARDSYPALREELGRLWAAGLVAELLIKTSGGGGDFPFVLELGREALRALDSRSPERGDYAVALFLWRLVGLLGLGPDTEACVSCGRGLSTASLGRAAGEVRGGDDGRGDGRDSGGMARGGGAGGGNAGRGEDQLAFAYSFGAEGFLCPSCARAASRGSSAATGDAARTAPGFPRGPAAEWRRPEDGAFARESGAFLRILPAALDWLRDSEKKPFAEAVMAGLDGPALAGLKALLFGLARRAAEAPLASLASGFLPT